MFRISRSASVSETLILRTVSMSLSAMMRSHRFRPVLTRRLFDQSICFAACATVIGTSSRSWSQQVKTVYETKCGVSPGEV